MHRRRAVRGLHDAHRDADAADGPVQADVEQEASVGALPILLGADQQGDPDPRDGRDLAQRFEWIGLDGEPTRNGLISLHGLDALPPSRPPERCIRSYALLSYAWLSRLSVALDPELGAAIREAAAARSTSVSAWLAQAAEHELRNQRLGEAISAWEAENGAITDEELAATRREVAEAAAEARRR